jgi:AcrR family transcriptional regulator
MLHITDPVSPAAYRSVYTLEYTYRSVYSQGMDETERVSSSQGLRSLTAAAERVLEAASELFYRDGIRAVGVDTIAEESGVTKMTLYKHFGSKDQLVAEYLRVRDDRWRAWLREAVKRRSETPREQILAVFDALEEWLDCGEGYRGCAFVNAAVELADQEHPAHAVIEEQKRWMREYFAGMAAAAGAREPEWLAEQLMVLYEGANVTSVMRNGQNTTRPARSTAETLLAELGL